MTSRSSSAVNPAAWMSLISGREILPSGRTGTVPLIASFFQTVMRRTSSGPIRYASSTTRLAAAPLVELVLELAQPDPTQAATRTRALPKRRFAKEHFIDSSSRGRPRGRPLAVESGLLDLVEQRPVADAQRPRRPHPVPPGLLEHSRNRLALGRLRCPSRDLLEGRLAHRGWGGGPSAVDADVRQRNPRQERIVQHDHPLDQVLELAHVPRKAVACQALHDRRWDREAVAAIELGVAI